MHRIALLGLVAVPSLAAAQTPIQLNYSGRLLDSTGSPMTTAISLEISLHTAETGGTVLHDETFSLTPDGGYFSVMLGENEVGDPLYASEIPTSGELWAAIAIDGTQLGARTRIASGLRAATAVSSLIGIEETGGVRRWADGSLGTSCLDYREPPEGMVYSGDTGDGAYRIAPDGVVGNAYDVVCDMTRDGGGWTLLMKAASSTFSYDSSHWTTSSTTNTGDLDTDHTTAAKFASFNNLPVNELMITAWNGGRTQLGMPSEQTALQLFQASGQTMYVTGGARTPADLINAQHYTHCGVAWRTNSLVGGSGIRLGGYVSYVWGCEYGNDATGTATGAHLLGFGTRDTRWSPFTGSNKSFGVRDAHDHNYIPPGQGAQSAHLWGR